ncbi:hypothetical protein FHG87_019316, partial [Trinorchestia longiramus]
MAASLLIGKSDRCLSVDKIESASPAVVLVSSSPLKDVSILSSSVKNVSSITLTCNENLRSSLSSCSFKSISSANIAVCGGKNSIAKNSPEETTEDSSCPPSLKVRKLSGLWGKGGGKDWQGCNSRESSLGGKTETKSSWTEKRSFNVRNKSPHTRNKSPVTSISKSPITTRNKSPIYTPTKPSVNKSTSSDNKAPSNNQFKYQELQEEVGSLLQFRDAVAAALPLVHNAHHGSHPSSYPSPHPHHHPMMVSHSASSPYLFPHHHHLPGVASPHHNYYPPDYGESHHTNNQHHLISSSSTNTLTHRLNFQNSYPPPAGVVVSSSSVKNYVTLNNSKNDKVAPVSTNEEGVVSGGGGGGGGSGGGVGGAASGGGGVSDSGFTDKNWWSGSMSAKTSSNASSGTEEENLNMAHLSGGLGGLNRFPGVLPTGGYITHLGMGRQGHVVALQGPHYGVEAVTSTTDTLATSTAQGVSSTTAATSTSSGSVSALEDELWQLLDVIQVKGSKLRLELSEAQKRARIYEGEFDPGGLSVPEFYARRMGGCILPSRLSEDVQSDPSHPVGEPYGLQPLPEHRICAESEPLWPLSLPPFQTNARPGCGSSFSRQRSVKSRESRFPFTAEDLIHPASGIIASQLRHSSPDSSPRHPNQLWHHQRGGMNQGSNHQLVSSLVSRASMAEKEANESQQRLTDLHACLNLLLAEKRKLERELARRSANERLFLETHGHHPEMASSGADPYSFYRHHESYPPMQYVPYRQPPYGPLPARRVPNTPHQAYNFSYPQDPNLVNPHSLPQPHVRLNATVSTPQSSPMRGSQQIALPRVRKVPIRDSNKVPGDAYRKQNRSASATERRQQRPVKAGSTDPVTAKTGSKKNSSDDPRSADLPCDAEAHVFPLTRPRSKSLSNMRSSKSRNNVLPETVLTSKGAFPKYQLAPSGMLSTDPAACTRVLGPDPALPPRYVGAHTGPSPSRGCLGSSTAPAASRSSPRSAVDAYRTTCGVSTSPSGSRGEAVLGVQSLPASVRVSPGGRVSVTPNRGRIAAILRERNVLELQRQLLHTVMEAEVLRCQVKVIQQQRLASPTVTTSAVTEPTVTTKTSPTITTSSVTAPTVTTKTSLTVTTSSVSPPSVAHVTTPTTTTSASPPAVTTSVSPPTTTTATSMSVVTTSSGYRPSLVTSDGTSGKKTSATHDSQTSDDKYDDTSNKYRTSGLRGGASGINGNDPGTTNRVSGGTRTPVSSKTIGADIFRRVSTVQEATTKESRLSSPSVVDKVDAIDKLQRRLSRATNVDEFLLVHASPSSKSSAGSRSVVSAFSVTDSRNLLASKCTVNKALACVSTPAAKNKDVDAASTNSSATESSAANFHVSEGNAAAPYEDHKDKLIHSTLGIVSTTSAKSVSHNEVVSSSNVASESQCKDLENDNNSDKSCSNFAVVSEPIKPSSHESPSASPSEVVEEPTFMVHKGPNVKYHVMVHKDSDESLGPSKSGTPRSGSFNSRYKSGGCNTARIYGGAGTNNRERKTSDGSSGSYGSSGSSAHGAKGCDSKSRTPGLLQETTRERLESHHLYTGSPDVEGTPTADSSGNVKDRSLSDVLSDVQNSRDSTIRAILANRQVVSRSTTSGDANFGVNDGAKPRRLTASSSLRSKSSRTSQSPGTVTTTRSASSPVSKAVVKQTNSSKSTNPICASSSLVAKIMNSRISSLNQANPDFTSPKFDAVSTMQDVFKSETSSERSDSGSKYVSPKLGSENKDSSVQHMTNYRKMSVAVEKPPRKSRSVVGVNTGGGLNSRFLTPSSGSSRNGLATVSESIQSSCNDGRQSVDVSLFPNHPPCSSSSFTAAKFSEGKAWWCRDASVNHQNQLGAVPTDAQSGEQQNRVVSSVLRTGSDNISFTNTSFFNSKTSCSNLGDANEGRHELNSCGVDSSGKSDRCLSVDKIESASPAVVLVSSSPLRDVSILSSSVKNVSSITLTCNENLRSSLSSCSFKSISSANIAVCGGKNSIAKNSPEETTEDSSCPPSLKVRKLSGLWGKGGGKDWQGCNSRESSLGGKTETKSSWTEKRSFNVGKKSPHTRNKSPVTSISKSPITTRNKSPIYTLTKPSVNKPTSSDNKAPSNNQFKYQ